MPSRDSGRDDWDKPFWQQRSWMISAVFIVSMLALAGLTMSSLSKGQTPAASPTPVALASPYPTSAPAGTSAPATPSAAASGSAQPADDRGPGCRTDDTNQVQPSAAPPGTVFKPLGVTLVPTSTTAGPLIYEGGVWRCYAHTPVGAALAATTLSVIDTPRDDWEQPALTQITPSSAAQKYVTTRRAAPFQKAVAGATVKMAGYAMMTYSTQEAQVMLLASIGPGKYVTIVETVRWVNGDWRLVAGDDGALPSHATPIGGTDGFVVW